MEGAPELLAAFPEWKVALPGAKRGASQNDVFALVRCGSQRLAVMVEGKVKEPFGPTVAEWLAGASKGKLERLEFLQHTLRLKGKLPDELRYQLLHRTASAVIEAERFGTQAAAMLVHSFAPDHLWFDDYKAFAALFGIEAKVGKMARATLAKGPALYMGWAVGDPAFLKA